SSDIRPLAIFSETDGTPSIGSDPQDLVSNSVFLGGSRGRSYTALSAQENSDLDTASHWINVSLAANTHPQWATAFGGILTTGSVPYSLPSATSVLAQVHGQLRTTAGRVIATTTSHLRWWPLPSGPNTVMCSGTCVIVLTTSTPPGKAQPAAHWYGLSFREITPWAYAVDMHKSGRVETLRFAERYTGYWGAILNQSDVLKHLCLNTVLNGWIVPANISGTVYVIEWLAFSQFLLECAALLCVLMILAKLTLKKIF
ncbi:MAG: hypothetical protein ACYDA1_09630, partial [Vulcanimicrobiaceae bacterium]